MPSPIVTATLQAAALSAASNVCAQWYQAYSEHRSLTLDLVPLLHFVILAFISVPPNYKWQLFLEHQFPKQAPSRLLVSHAKDVEKKARADGRGGLGRSRLSLRNTFAKWFIDCITIGAVWNTVLFLIVMGLLKREPAWQIWHNLKTETIPITVAGYRIWPFASIISFVLVPVHRRIMWLNICGFLWGIYMSLVATRV